MSESLVRCPNCQTEINVNEVLYQQLEAKLQQAHLQETESQDKAYQQKLAELKAEQDKLQAQQTMFDKRVAAELEAQLKAEKTKLTRQLKQQLQIEGAAELKLLQAELNEKSRQVSELNRTRAQLAKLEREKQEIKSAVEAKAAQQLTEALQQEQQKIQKQYAEQSELKLREKEAQLASLRRELQNAQRKAEQGSMQTQGETLELAIEAWLGEQFPFDTISEIKKGQRGADCLQTVNTREIADCGTIYYESKRTKEFQRSWLEKFKQDMRDKGCDIGVLVTTVLPKELQRFGLLDGVWVCTYAEFKGLSLVLRESLIKLSYVKRSQENKSDKMAVLYHYLTSEEFKGQIEAIVEGFSQMQTDLETEKRAMLKIWKQREKQITKVINNTVGMYGSLRGIAGNNIAQIEALELPYSE